MTDEQIPSVAFGVYRMTDETDCRNNILDALEAGYRHIDTAAIYMNEDIVGKTLKQSSVSRDDIFLTTKLWCQDDGYERASKAIDAALSRLRTDYIDLLMIHEPMGDIYGQWRAMEDACRAGKVRMLGVSNMFPDKLMDFCLHTEIKPVINQMRTNPFCQQKEAHSWMKELGVIHQAHSPFSQGNRELLNHPVLRRIAQAHEKNTGQIILRWLIQSDILPVTSSTKKQRMRENLDIFSFTLSEEEMQEINSLDRLDGNTFDQRKPEVVRTINSWRYDYEKKENKND